MTIDQSFSLTALVFSLISLLISIISFIRDNRTRKLAMVSFRKQLMEPYLNWRDRLDTIELDPRPGEVCRTYTGIERRKIRDYWPKVAKVELELLKSTNKKLIQNIWKDWERLLKEGMSHRSVLQEFCYYAVYEDAINDPTQKELLEIVGKLYQEMNSEKLNYSKYTIEREKYTKN